MLQEDFICDNQTSFDHLLMHMVEAEVVQRRLCPFV
jgi:hypothetical protein